MLSCFEYFSWYVRVFNVKLIITANAITGHEETLRLVARRGWFRNSPRNMSALSLNICTSGGKVKYIVRRFRGSCGALKWIVVPDWLATRRRRCLGTVRFCRPRSGWRGARTISSRSAIHRMPWPIANIWLRLSVMMMMMMMKRKFV